MTACAEPAGQVHSAFFYRGEREYVDVLLRFVQGGLRDGEPVLVAVPGRNLGLLRDALDEVPPGVTLADMTAVGRNPRQILAMEGTFLAKHPGRPVRMVGEVIWPGRSDDEYPGCVTHEALVNAAFAGRDMVGLCPYDACGLAEEVLADARATHPFLWQDGAAHSSAGYAPDEAL